MEDGDLRLALLRLAGPLEKRGLWSRGTSWTSRMAMADGYAIAPEAPGLGIDWNFAAIERLAVARATIGK